MLAGQSHGGQQRFLGELLVGGGAKARAGSFQGQRQGAQPGGAQDGEQLGRKSVGPHRGQGKLRAPLPKPGQKRDELGPIGQRRADQADLSRRHGLDERLEVGQTRLARRAVDVAGGAEAAAVGTAAIDLDQKHVAEFGMARHETGMGRGGKERGRTASQSRGPGDGAERAAGQVDAGEMRHGVQAGGLVAAGKGHAGQGGADLGQPGLGLAHEKEIQGRQKRRGIEKGQRAAGHDDGKIEALFATKGNFGGHKGLGRVEIFLFVAQGKGDDRKFGQGAAGILGLGRGGGAGEDALHGQGGILGQKPPGGLPAQGRKGHGGVAGNSQGHGQPSAPFGRGRPVQAEIDLGGIVQDMSRPPLKGAGGSAYSPRQGDRGRSGEASPPASG